MWCDDNLQEEIGGSRRRIRGKFYIIGVRGANFFNYGKGKKKRESVGKRRGEKEGKESEDFIYIADHIGAGFRVFSRLYASPRAADRGTPHAAWACTCPEFIRSIDFYVTLLMNRSGYNFIGRQSVRP